MKVVVNDGPSISSYCIASYHDLLDESNGFLSFVDQSGVENDW